MCRSIKVLRQPDRPATDQELYEASLQFVRKISGFRKPARVNQEVFDAAVAEITATSRLLLERLHVPKRPANATVPSFGHRGAATDDLVSDGIQVS